MPQTEGGYLVPVTGAIAANGVATGPRDGLAITQETKVAIEPTDLVLVDDAA